MDLAAVVVAALLVVLIAGGALAARQRSVLMAVRRALPEPVPEAALARAVRREVELARAAATQLGQRDDDLRELAELVGVGLVQLDDALTVRFANGAAHAMLARAPGGLHGLSLVEAFVDHRLEEAVMAARRRAGAQREVTLDGGQRTLIVRARRTSSGAWVVLEDASELRRLQRIRAEFIDNLSHELRTPLTTVRLLTETLMMELERTELPPRIRDGIVKIDVESGHLAQMVNELLDLAQIEQGTTAPRFDDVDLGEVIDDAIRRLQPFAERQGVTLARELPEDPDDRNVRGDHERLGQLMLNLLHNAVKFSREGGPVTIRARRADAEVVVSVEDRGVGIPRGELDRIFERFYKVDKARFRGQGGTGLGLAIARHVVETHGGRIWVQSREGEGSTFSFAIPRAASAVEARTAS